MKPIEGYDLVNEAGEFKQLPKGIYPGIITKVVDVPEKEYLEVYADVVKGEYKDYFKTLTDSGLKDSSKTTRSYKTNALPFFKAFITAVEKSNPNFRWDWDEKKLEKKYVVLVVGEEEYEDKDGNIRIGTKIMEFRSVEAMKEGRIKIPELKKLNKPEEQKVIVNEKAEQLTEVPDSELPF